DAASELTCLIAGSKVDIRARRTDNGRAGILGDHQPSKTGAALVGSERQTGLDKKWGAVHMQRVVDGNRASRCKRYALGADRFPVIGQPNDPKKSEGWVLPQHFLGALWIGVHPFPDAIERDRLTRDDIALDENATDRHIRVSVVGSVVD